MARNNQSEESSKVVGGGVSFTGLLALVFIVLKLTGVIDWSWVWVLSPIWIPFAIVAVVFVGIMIIIHLKK